MHLFSPERPEASPGQKALLTDGSAIPNFIITVLPNDKLRLQVMLRHYDQYGGYSYKSVETGVYESGDIFSEFLDDPEHTLKKYFNWEPQTKIATITKVNEITLEAKQYAEDLL